MNVCLTGLVKKAYDVTYRNLGYTLSGCSMAGVGNGLASQDFKAGFGQGFVNHFPWGFAVSYTYSIVFHFLQKTDHYRLYANLYQAAITTGIVAYHYWVGTDHPFETALPVAAIIFPILNKHVSDTQKLESMLSVDK
jgi:hypothetical protein